MLRTVRCVVALVAATVAARVAADEPHPLAEKERKELAAKLDAAIAETTERLGRDPRNVDLHSRRGDAHFFRGDFANSVADYDRMVELNPELDASHWRRGIAFFYAGRYDDAARQFERYHTFDDVDRENGIWRYLSQVKADGLEKARAGLLKYRKDDREPFPAVYQLFAGKITPDDILQQIGQAEIGEAERSKRLFYAQLYIGLNHAIEDRPDKARPHLREAVANTWARRAGYGPNYMWHVGRLHYERLRARTPPAGAAPTAEPGFGGVSSGGPR